MLTLPPGDTSLNGNCLIPVCPVSTANALSLGIYQMDTRGFSAHMIIALGPIDEHFQIVEAHFHITVRGVHLLLSVNAYIDFIQPMLRHGDGLAVAENGISTPIVLVLVSRGYIHQPQLITKALRGNNQIGKFHGNILSYSADALSIG